MRVLLALALVVIAAFCSFGFLATYEPLESALGWRIGYGAAVIACLFGAWRLLRGGTAAR